MGSKTNSPFLSCQAKTMGSGQRTLFDTKSLIHAPKHSFHPTSGEAALHSPARGAASRKGAGARAGHCPASGGGWPGMAPQAAAGGEPESRRAAYLALPQKEILIGLRLRFQRRGAARTGRKPKRRPRGPRRRRRAGAFQQRSPGGRTRPCERPAAEEAAAGAPLVAWRSPQPPPARAALRRGPGPALRPRALPALSNSPAAAVERGRAGAGARRGAPVSRELSSRPLPARSAPEGGAATQGWAGPRFPPVAVAVRRRGPVPR